MSSDHSGQGSISTWSCELRKLKLTIVVFEKCNGCFQYGRLVHFTVASGNHGEELVDQHVELISPLLLTQVTCFPAKNWKKKSANISEMDRHYENFKVSDPVAL